MKKFALRVKRSYHARMQASSLCDTLRLRGLKDTAPRRLIAEALCAIASPSAAKDIHEWIVRERGARVGLVTVYRVLDVLESLGAVHRHAAEGVYSVCHIPSVHGHHVLLHCGACGNVEERHDHSLCDREDDIARSAGFEPVRHVSEILGTCHSCQ